MTCIWEEYLPLLLKSNISKIILNFPALKVPVCVRPRGCIRMTTTKESICKLWQARSCSIQVTVTNRVQAVRHFFDTYYTCQGNLYTGRGKYAKKNRLFHATLPSSKTECYISKNLFTPSCGISTWFYLYVDNLACCPALFRHLVQDVHACNLV